MVAAACTYTCMNVYIDTRANSVAISQVLTPYQEKSVDLQGRLDAETRRANALEVEKNALCEENMVCRQLIAQLGGDLGLLPERTAAFSREQEALIDELQQQVGSFEKPLLRCDKSAHCMPKTHHILLVSSRMPWAAKFRVSPFFASLEFPNAALCAFVCTYVPVRIAAAMRL
jgi:hypothetical protein